MLLVLTSLWQQSDNDVVVEGEGVFCNAQVGTGEVLISAAGTVGGKRRRKSLAHGSEKRPLDAGADACAGSG